MTTTALLAYLLWPLLVFGIPVAVFTSIGHTSWPRNERTPITQWSWTDLYSNFHRGLRLSSENSRLSQLINDAPAPTPQDSTNPPHPASH